MKNKRIEAKIRNAKRYAKAWNRPVNAQSNYIVHCYDEPKQYGWWDDVFFKLGSQVVAVWWVHPRQRYVYLCDELVEQTLSRPPIDMTTNSFTTTPIYPTNANNKKNSKKAKQYQVTFSPNRLALFEEKQKLRQQILLTSDIVVTPYMQVMQYDWCRGVDICLPMEVVDETSVDELALIVRKLLTCETTLAELYPDYHYSKFDWQQENHSP